MRIRLFLLLVGALSLVGVPSSHASNPHVVISQVFGGGGNGGAPLKSDFIELFNPGTTAVDLDAWSVQYATASSTSWQRTPLTGSIAPGHYLLVQEASGGDVGAALSTPDVVGTINLSAASGKVALVSDGTSLDCGGSPGSCSARPNVVDLVGYGSAADYEGAAAAPALGATTAAVRAGNGCNDTDSNASDFAAAAPAPRGSASPSASCGGAGSGDSAPAVASTTPQAGATSVATDATVTVAFDEAVTLDAGWFALACAQSGSHAATVTGGPSVYTLHPSTPFAAGEPCTVTVTPEKVHDVDALDPPDELTAPFTLSFTTAQGGQQGAQDGADASVDAEIQPVLTVVLDKSTLSFSSLAWNTTPSPLSASVTVVGNSPGGYTLSVHRSVFTPDDLPLGLGASAAPTAQLGPALAGGVLAPVPVAPAADLLIGSSSKVSARAGDVWPVRVGFLSPVPLVSAGRHSATLTFTVIGR